MTILNSAIREWIEIPPSVPAEIIDREPEADLFSGIPYRGQHNDWAKRLTPEGLLDTSGILPPLDSPPRDVIPPVTTVNHGADLCVCQHSRLQHSSVLGGSDHHTYETAGWDRRLMIPSQSANGIVTDICSGTRNDHPCSCRNFNRVSSKSVHVFQRGSKVERRKVADLLPGQRVTAGWTPSHGKVRLHTERTGSLVATVVSKRPALVDDNDRHWTRRMWIVTTELGDSLPIAGGDPVLVVKS